MHNPALQQNRLVLLQSSSYGESISTLGFGSRVSEITLGQAKKNSESAQIFDAKDQMIRCVCLFYLATICLLVGARTMLAVVQPQPSGNDTELHASTTC